MKRPSHLHVGLPRRGRRLLLALALLPAGGALGLAWAAAPSSHEPPGVQAGADDEAAESRLVAERAIRENCLICHGDDLITTQRLTPKQWKAEVEKMVGWGAPLPVELHGPVTVYLTERYPATAPAPVLARAPLAALAAGLEPIPDGVHGPVDQGGALYQRNCANCHGPDGLGHDLGPNLVEKPILYRRGEYAALVAKGQGRMPGFGAVINEADGDRILAWLRTRVYRPQTAATR